MEVPQEILNRYLERRKKDLEVCLENLESENFAEIEKLGHQLKGNGLTFGHAELSDIGSHMEEAAAVRDSEELHRVLEEFSHWVHEHFN